MGQSQAIGTSDAAPSADLDSFRMAMSNLASGVNVITVWDDHGVPHGMTATAFCSVSADPPQVLICVNRSTRTHSLISHTGLFGVSMLARCDSTISAHCSRPGGDKQLDRSWLAASTSSQTPALEAALFHVDCKVAGQLDAGTHTVIVGLVRTVAPGSGDDPLLYFRGAYRRLAPLDPAMTHSETGRTDR